MSESLAVGDAVARPGVQERLAVLDPRRKLQLALGALWLLDGLLQYQPSMFSKSFPQMLAESAQGNPGVIARPITWSASIIDHHLVVLNAVFATIQLALGLGIAWRPTVKLALGASVAWSLGVWWFGEGLGGVLAWIDNRAASALSHQGLPASIVLAVVLGLIAVGVYLPVRSARMVVVLAVVVAVALGLAQGLGGIFTGSATDPDSGPLAAQAGQAGQAAQARPGFPASSRP